MKFNYKLLLAVVTAIILQSCGKAYKVPSYIEKEQREFNRTQERLKDSRVISPLPDIQLTPIEMIPDTTQVGIQSLGNWGYEFLEVDKWESTIKEKATRKVAVFVFDTGIDLDHPLLKDYIKGARNHTTDPSADDGNGHGTHVAGTVAAKVVQGAKLGIANVLAEKGLLDLYSEKVLTDRGSGSYSWISKAISIANVDAEKLIDQGYFVVYNFSLGGSISSSSIDRYLKEAQALGVLISTAANGNTGRESSSYPAGSDYTLGIASVTNNGQRSNFSTYGKFTSFALPGSGIKSTYKDKRIATLSGTSMGSPHGAAVCAIMASMNPNATAGQIVAHMQKYSVEAGIKGWDKYYGYGIPKLTDLLQNPVSDENPPQEPPQDEEPPKDEEPDDTTEPGPATTDCFYLPKTYNISWRTLSESGSKILPFEVKVSYKHNKSIARAAYDVSSVTDSHFKKRGLVLNDGDDEKDAAYWTAYFYRLIVKKKYDMNIEEMIITVGDVRYKIDKFDKKPTQKKATKSGAITYQY